MFSSQPNLLRSFAFRLSLWYAGLFAISTSLVLLVVFYLVALELQVKDKEILVTKWNEYAAIYQTRGADVLASVASHENNPADDKSFYINLVSPHFSGPIIVPDEWLGFRLKPGSVEWRQFVARA